ncbi:hypothetical protein [Streptomyces sasae]|uniref:hypothetical protein n=1 Tax=Streptomyces sasae TaxID=1266772 RepID=UPI002930A0F6|nr:hypothetical protein [Streptomyces sasae]
MRTAHDVDVTELHRRTEELLTGGHRLAPGTGCCAAASSPAARPCARCPTRPG